MSSIVETIRRIEEREARALCIPCGFCGADAGDPCVWRARGLVLKRVHRWRYSEAQSLDRIGGSA